MARLELRVPRDFKKALERAAAVSGHPTVSSFILAALRASTSKVIEDQKRAKLSAAESINFVKALLTPPSPNAALRATFARYRDQAKAGA